MKKCERPDTTYDPHAALARSLYDAWCEEFNPDPSWETEDASVCEAWLNIARRLSP